MTKISGIFAASMSVLNNDLSLNVEKTIMHAEKLIDQGCHGTDASELSAGFHARCLQAIIPDDAGCD